MLFCVKIVDIILNYRIIISILYVFPWCGMDLPHENDFCSLGALREESDNQNMELKRLKDVAIEEHKRENLNNI